MPDPQRFGRPPEGAEFSISEQTQEVPNDAESLAQTVESFFNLESVDEYIAAATEQVQRAHVREELQETVAKYIGMAKHHNALEARLDTHKSEFDQDEFDQIAESLHENKGAIMREINAWRKAEDLTYTADEIMDATDKKAYFSRERNIVLQDILVGDIEWARI